MQQQAENDHGALKVLSSTASKSVMAELGPLFERRSGIALSIDYGTSNQLLDRIGNGESADVALLTAAGIDALIAAGQLAPGSRMDFAQTGISVAMRPGAPRPDIATVEAFRHALLQASSVTYTATGASGVYFSTVLERLGIADQVKAKAQTPAGGLIGELLVRGEAELGVQLTCELLAVPGLVLAGPLPQELQNIVVFSVGSFIDTAHALQAQSFYRFLATTEARKIMEQKGMQAA